MSRPPEVPRVSVVIPSYNAAGTIARTLEAVARQRFDDSYEVIVVDDGSSDDTVAVAEGCGGSDGSVRVIRQANKGPGPARNHGVANSRAQVIAFTDADCFPESDWLQQGLIALEHADLVQGLVRADPSSPPGPWDRTIEVPSASGLFETANLFVRRDLFDALGGFEIWLEPKIGKPLGEDVWLGWRARRTGARVDFCREAVVNHAVFARGPLEFIAYKRTLVHVPSLVRKVPELRTTLLHRRYFAGRRTFRFDLAIAAVALAALTRSRLPLAATFPYAWTVARQMSSWRERDPIRVALVELAADFVTLYALARGSVEERTLVL